MFNTIKSFFTKRPQAVERDLPEGDLMDLSLEARSLLSMEADAEGYIDTTILMFNYSPEAWTELLDKGFIVAVSASEYRTAKKYNMGG